MSQIKLTVNNKRTTVDEINELAAYGGDQRQILTRLDRLMGNMAEGSEAQSMTLQIDGGRGAVQARGTLTLTGVVAGNTVQVGDQVFVASASPVGPNQFLVGANDAATAVNLAAAINANPSLMTSSGNLVTAVDNLLSVNYPQTTLSGAIPYPQTYPYTITVSNTAGLTPGLSVSDTGGYIPAGAVITTVVNGTTLNISLNTTNVAPVASDSMTFSPTSLSGSIPYPQTSPPTLVVSNTASLAAGMAVTDTGGYIPAGATVLAVIDSTHVSITKNTTNVAPVASDTIAFTPNPLYITSNVITITSAAYGNSGNMIQLVGSSNVSPLGVAATYAALGASAVTGSAGAGSSLMGDLGIYPNTSSSITNFPPSTYSGTENAGNAAAAAAQAAAQAAYTSMHTMTSTTIPTALDSQTLSPGVYSSSSGTFTLAGSGTGTLTLNGNGTYIFQTASTLTTGAGGAPVMNLTGGALASNVYWVVGSSATINSGTAGTFQGSIIAQASVTDTLGGTVNGSLIALTGAVTYSATATSRANGNASSVDITPSGPYLNGGIEPTPNTMTLWGIK